MWPLIDKRGIGNACGFVIEMKVIRTLMLINHLVYSLPLLHKTDELNSLRKQPTFCDATTGFPLKWRRSNDYWWGVTTPLGSGSDWSRRERNLLQPIRSTTQIRVVTSHQYGILRSFLRQCRGMSGVPCRGHILYFNFNPRSRFICKSLQLHCSWKTTSH